jgi:hypothetical protein
MTEQYLVPELTLVGETNDVVFGSLRVGTDSSGQKMPSEMEFEADDKPTMASR